MLFLPILLRNANKVTNKKKSKIKVMAKTRIEFKTCFKNVTCKFCQRMFDGSTDLLKNRGLPRSVAPDYDHFLPIILYPPVILEATSYPPCFSNVMYALTGVFNYSLLLLTKSYILDSIFNYFYFFPSVIADPRFSKSSISFLFAVANVIAAISNISGFSFVSPFWATILYISFFKKSFRASKVLPPCYM